MADGRTQTYFLVEFEDRVASWCQIASDEKIGGEAWVDLKGRRTPFDDGRPIHHMDVPNIAALLDVAPVFGGILRESAKKHLLDPTSDQGWIDPAGTFFGCRFYAHDDMALSFFGCHVGALEGAGYVRVHSDSYQHEDYWTEITPAQRKTLEGLGFYDGRGGFPSRIRKMDRKPLHRNRIYVAGGDERRLPPLGDATRIVVERRDAARRAAGLDAPEADDEVPSSPSPV